MVGVSRRVPWSSPDELHQVFSWLFAGDGDAAVQRYAIGRIKVWMSRGNCPHAIESTASLLELVLRDTANVGPSQRPSQHELRLAYSMALIRYARGSCSLILLTQADERILGSFRFVNSLVDPLQTTYFARSMASLAAQLGLPLWFVELRHAATHEDLPGIAVLRDAARQALDWLYSNYWIPTLTPSSSSQTINTIPPIPIDNLQPLLTSYKTLMKRALRDASKSKQIRPDLARSYRAIQSWVAEAESMGRGRERAIEGLVEGLLEVGCLVPEAKKKRVTLRAPTLSAELVAIWSPLLERLDEMFEGLQDALLARIVESLGTSSALERVDSTTQVNPLDRSYYSTLSAWVVQLVSTTDDTSSIENLIKSLLIQANPISLTLVETLSNINENLSKIVKPLIEVMRQSETKVASSIEVDGVEDQLAEMERRLKEMEEKVKLSETARTPAQASSLATNGHPTMKNGWTLVQSWKPCPIGASGSLDLPPFQL
ncbi:BZ3500_MvSof-1268-A1-R1_Chr3-2g06364 [Microbotryum saponariae]|uniref:BZ3500_MvSof-1268-A1-R1_Chr3-2g06364 protein n=1 Tax=Microbotryum saponariae TaxID=289078 RepID=A0A2X0MVG9_9BASI|nr:BZ3500_MvSof-1268-A1-R1_Chr3-2g06364 [Microbotryum saponariae]SDA04335.1 BZ3501_MvSof-1269-A2-R1_Chr3-2g06055 [Microbotryum saponariae]